jgi:hypothetical protein
MLAGEPIEVSFRAGLTCSRGKLYSKTNSGTPVHAGSDIRRREMVIDTDLVRHSPELARIFVHEVFHFVWVKLGNQRRRAYEAILNREIDERAKGELGWSAEMLKAKLTASDRKNRSTPWRCYSCESFCDTAAWLYSGLTHHKEWTLGQVYRRRRARCMKELLDGRTISV